MSAAEPTGVVRKITPSMSLTSALRASSAGDVVELQNGTYGSQWIDPLALPGVTVRGQSRTGVVVKGFTFRGVSGLDVETMTVVNAASSSSSAIRVYDGSRDLAFKDLTISPQANAAFDVWARTTRVSLADSTLTGPGGAVDEAADATSRGVRINGAPYDVASWPTDITIRGNDISGFASDLIQVGGAQRVLIRDNDLHDPKVTDEHNDGVQSFGSNDLRIEGNRFSAPGPNSPDQAIMLGHQGTNANLRVNRTTIVNNVIKPWRGTGINLGGTDATTLVNNTVARSGTSTSPGSSLGIHGSNPSLQVFNNVFDKIYTTTSSRGDHHHNCVRTGGLGTSLITSDPKFVDSSYLISPLSPCRDRGTVTGAPKIDITTAARDTMPDIGAYEVGAVAATTTTSTGTPATRSLSTARAVRRSVMTALLGARGSTRR